MQPGLRVHQPRAWADRRQPAATLPQTRIEDTVLDLIDADAGGRRRRALGPAGLPAPAHHAPPGCGRRRRNVGVFGTGRLVRELLAEAADGVASPLERRYRLDVELAHGLPRAERGGAWAAPDGRRRYFDVRYKLWRLRVELEGLAFHPEDRSWVDHARDNAAVQLGDVVLRYGWRAVTATPCEVAAQVAAVLTLRGWPGRLTPCGPSCRADRARSRSEATLRQI